MHAAIRTKQRYGIQIEHPLCVVNIRCSGRWKTKSVQGKVYELCLPTFASIWPSKKVGAFIRDSILVCKLGSCFYGEFTRAGILLYETLLTVGRNPIPGLGVPVHAGIFYLACSAWFPFVSFSRSGCVLHMCLLLHVLFAC